MSGSVIYFCHSDHIVNTSVTSCRVKNLTNDVGYTHARKRTYVGLCKMCLMNVPLRICNHSLYLYLFSSNVSSVASKADNELLVFCLLAIRCSAWCSFLNACQ